MSDERWNGFLDRLAPFRPGETTGATHFFPDIRNRKRETDTDTAALTRDHHKNLEVVNDIVVALVNDAANRKRDISDIQEELQAGRDYTGQLKALLGLAVLFIFVGEPCLFVLLYMTIL